MIDYKRWKQLNESFGFPLSIKSPVQIGALASILDEKKHSKKMLGDVEDGIGGGDDVDVQVKKPVDVPAEKPEDDDDHGDCDCDCHKGGGDDDVKMCKKCSKKMKKNMKKEDTNPAVEFMNSLNSYVADNKSYKLGTEEYRQEFFKSLARQFGTPGQKYDDGKTFGEDLLLPGTTPELTPVAPEVPQESSTPPEERWDSSFQSL